MSTEPLDVLTVPQAAALLQIGKNSLYDAIGRNEVPHRRVGKHIRISRIALMAWLDSCGHSQVLKEG